jgi:3-oxoacyl-[acyl-carrier-protein] synthase II
MTNEVVITGVGVVAPNGIGRVRFLKALQEGTSGIDEIRSFDTRDYLVHRGGEIKHLEHVDGDGCPPGVGRTTRVTIIAVREAMADAGLLADSFDSDRVGVLLGTTSGEVQDMEAIDEAWTRNRSEVFSSAAYSSFCSNSITARVASAFGLRGPALVLANACASGNFAVAFGCDLIKQGHADVIVAGGADALSKVALAGFSRMHAVAPDLCRPFDRNRKGMMVSEGAGVVILEAGPRARARGASMYARVRGWGLGCDAFHLTAPNPEGMAHVMCLAMQDAGVAPADIGYISAHGTGTTLNDAAETAAIRTAFGDAANRTPVSSIKSMIGHTMGAASAIETVACCLALRHQFLPPTINYSEPDPQCDLDYVPNTVRFQAVDVAMNNSFAFGGNNASLVLARS